MVIVNIINLDKNYGMTHQLSPSRVMSRDRSISPHSNIGRPPSPPLPYSPDRDHFNSDNKSHRDRQKRSPDRKIHERFIDQLIILTLINFFRI